MIALKRKNLDPLRAKNDHCLEHCTRSLLILVCSDECECGKKLIQRKILPEQ